MSRIDEALRLAQPAGLMPEGPEGVAPSEQEAFSTAWAMADQLRDAAETPDPPPGSAAVAPSGRSTAILGFSSEWRERLSSGPDSDPGLTEQFRRLAATLHHAQLNNGLKSVMVTSASPGDGKTLTAVNLALVLAESYRYRVLLVDADLRRPSIPSVVDLGGGTGLSEALRAKTEQKLALLPLTSRLTLLPAGQAIANSIEALTSPRMRQILDEAAARYDWVILDAPPVGPTTDARLLTQMVGGTLFVIHSGQTQYPVVKQALDFLGREHIRGVVLNGVEPKDAEPYYGAV